MTQQQPELIDDIRWRHPSTIMIGGPSGSGKTLLTDSILANKQHLFNPVPQKTILFYREWQELYDIWKDAGYVDVFYNTFPEEDEFRERLDMDGAGTLVIFDDCSLQVEQHKEFFDNLFCISSHHLKITVVLIVHNLFTKSLRTLSLNAHRFFLTQSLRDKGQLQTLARQAFPGKSEFVIQAFDDSTKEQYGHICLDFSPGCNPITRVTSNWFAEPTALNCYLYKMDKKSSSIKMGSKAFTKLLLLPQSRYLKLISNDDSCGCNSNCQPSHSNNLHITRNISRLSGVGPESEIRGFTSAGGKENKGAENSVEGRGLRGEELQAKKEASPSFVNFQPEITVSSSDPSPHIPQPAQMETSPSLTASIAPPPAPPPPPYPSLMPPPPPPTPPPGPGPQQQSLVPRPGGGVVTQPSSYQPLQAQMFAREASRKQLHQELQQAIADRSSRDTPHFIERPPPQPIPLSSDIRQDLHDELHQAVAERRTLREGEGRIEEDNSQKSLDYEEDEKGKLKYSRAGQKAIETAVRAKQKKKAIQYSNPTRALENINVVKEPESIYPISLRSLDSDVAPPVKRTSRIPKRRPLKALKFSPSPPIEGYQEHSKPAGKKRNGNHLSKPKPTRKNKVQKLNQGDKRDGDHFSKPFPVKKSKVLKLNQGDLKPAKRLVGYPMWNL